MKTTLTSSSMSFLFLLLTPFLTTAQTAVPNQSDNYPLYTNVDTTYFNNIQITSRDKDWNMNVNVKTLIEYKQKLEPLLAKDDPWAIYLYAECHCHLVNTDFDYSTKGLSKQINISEDTSFLLNQKKCLKYLQKADGMNVAWATWILYNEYRMSDWLTQNNDLAWHYLQKTVKSGDNKLKAFAYAQMSNIYLPASNEAGQNPDFPVVSYDIDKGLHYNLLYYELNPDKDMKALAEQYRKYGRFDEAIDIYLRSKDWRMQYASGAALILGYFVKEELVIQDKERGLGILHNLIAIETNKPNGGQSQRMINLLNRLHYCYCDEFSGLYGSGEGENCPELISKEDVGKYYIENFNCP